MGASRERALAGAAALLAVCLTALPAARQRGTEAAGERQPALAAASEEEPTAAARPARVEAGELWAHPGRHLGAELELCVQFDAWLARWNPLVTRFGPGEYGAFTAWGVEQFPWRAEDYASPRARLFVRRGSAADWALERAQRHQSFVVQVAVRAVFDDVPWVEVLGVRPLLRTIPEGSVLHATRALELMERKAWRRADDELARALAAPLPEAAVSELERLRAECREELAELEARPLLRRRAD